MPGSAPGEGAKLTASGVNVRKASGAITARAGGSRRKLQAAQQRFGVAIVVIIPAFHRDSEVARVELEIRVIAEGQPGEHTRQFGNMTVVVSGNGLAIGIKNPCAVGAQLPQTDAEDLHYLAREILVRKYVAARHRLLIAKMTEENAHGGMCGNVVK